jgi:putative acetyltransferase
MVNKSEARKVSGNNSFIVRAVKLEDAEYLNLMRTMSGVQENILGMPSERVADSEAFVRNLTSNDHMLVAEKGGRVIGCVGLHVSSVLRTRHTASLGIMVHKDHQGQGVGTALLNAALDIADNWLMLKRVELCVFTDNEKAITLYQKLGFAIEGTKKYAAVRYGDYADEYLMARYKDT